MTDPALSGIACLSVDVDSLREYARIHGLPPEVAGNEVFDVAVGRFLDLFDAHGVKATFFVIGRDVAANPRNLETVRRIVARGHEVANHTQDHRYDLVHCDPAERRRQVRLAHEAIREAAGAEPVGFRAPGYHVDRGFLRLLAELGYSYDSSVFPCAPYMAAKAAAMGWMRLRGRRSGAILGDPRVLLAPHRPYWPDLDVSAFAPDPSGGRGTGLLEIPVTVLPGVGLPVIGTMVTLSGKAVVRRVLPALRRIVPFLNLEFHAADLLSIGEDHLHPALSAQPDLRLPLARKTEAVAEAVHQVTTHWRCMTLAEAARYG